MVGSAGADMENSLLSQRPTWLSVASQFKEGFQGAGLARFGCRE